MQVGLQLGGIGVLNNMGSTSPDYLSWSMILDISGEHFSRMSQPPSGGTQDMMEKKRVRRAVKSWWDDTY
jgi:hypothetical protein